MPDNAAAPEADTDDSADALAEEATSDREGPHPTGQDAADDGVDQDEQPPADDLNKAVPQDNWADTIAAPFRTAPLVEAVVVAPPPPPFVKQVTEAVANLLTLFAFTPSPATPTPADTGVPIVELLWGLWRPIQSRLLNTAPSAEPVIIGQDTATGQLFGTLNPLDRDGDLLRYNVIAPPQWGTVTVAANGQFVYTVDPTRTPTPGSQDTFTITITDEAAWPQLAWGSSGHATTVTLTVVVPEGSGELPDRPEQSVSTPVADVSWHSWRWFTSIPGGIAAASLGAHNSAIALIGTGWEQLIAVAPGMYAPNWKATDDWASGVLPIPTSSFGLDFVVEGSTSVEFQTFTPGWLPAFVDIWVDGRRVSDGPLNPGWLPGPNTLTIELPDDGPHRVQVMVTGAAIGQIWIGPGGVLSVPTDTTPRVFVLGDSLTAGMTTNRGSELGTWLALFARQVSVRDYWNGALGGTGFGVGKSVLPSYITRAQTELAASEADIVIVGTPLNDRFAGRTSAQIAADVTTVVSEVQKIPSSPYVIVLGAPDPQGINGADFHELDAAIRAAAKAAGAAYISPTTGSVYDRTGRLVMTSDPWVTEANRRAYISSTEDLHPTDDGQKYIAARMAEAYTALLAADSPAAQQH